MKCDYCSPRANTPKHLFMKSKDMGKTSSATNRPTTYTVEFI